MRRHQAILKILFIWTCFSCSSELRTSLESVISASARLISIPEIKTVFKEQDYPQGADALAITPPFKKTDGGYELTQAHNKLDSSDAKRIGFMSGTFDPIHEAHINTAHRAIEEYRLDLVILTTNSSQDTAVVKPNASPFEHKIKMIALRIAGEEKISLYPEPIDPRTERGGKGYEKFADALSKAYGTDELFLIGGNENLRGLLEHGFPDARKNHKLLISMRPDSDAKVEVPTGLKEHVGIVQKPPQIVVSSTTMRGMLKEGVKPSEKFMNSRVADYALEHGIYQ